jgi:hypothetical protein
MIGPWGTICIELLGLLMMKMGKMLLVLLLLLVVRQLLMVRLGILPVVLWVNGVDLVLLMLVPEAVTIRVWLKLVRERIGAGGRERVVREAIHGIE